MDFLIFSPSIEDRLITLHTAGEIVRFSSFIRHSISYLNLESCQYPTVSHCLSGSLCDCCISRSRRNFINTNEKFRKSFSPSRSLLYTLHLDMPKGREYSLKEVPESVNSHTYSSSPHISKISISDRFEKYVLNKFIDYALNTSFPKLKILKWLLEVSLFRLLDPNIANKFIDCFYPKIRDSALFREFVLQFGIVEFMVTKEQPGILENMLYCSRLYGRRDMEDADGDPIDKNIGRCIFLQLYLNIGAAMKYIDAPRFTTRGFVVLFKNILVRRPRLTGYILRRSKVERINYMLQIIVMYLDGTSNDCTEAASEALRLIWWSVPDACITYEEFKIVFEAGFSEEELKELHKFYVTAIVEFHENNEPRSLKHLCRTVLRRRLRENEVWIPEGIRRLGLPKTLQSFLNLEKPKALFA